MKILIALLLVWVIVLSVKISDLRDDVNYATAVAEDVEYAAESNPEVEQMRWDVDSLRDDLDSLIYQNEDEHSDIRRDIRNIQSNL